MPLAMDFPQAGVCKGYQAPIAIKINEGIVHFVIKA